MVHIWNLLAAGRVRGFSAKKCSDSLKRLLYLWEWVRQFPVPGRGCETRLATGCRQAFTRWRMKNSKHYDPVQILHGHATFLPVTRRNRECFLLDHIRCASCDKQGSFRVGRTTKLPSVNHCDPPTWHYSICINKGRFTEKWVMNGSLVISVRQRCVCGSRLGLPYTFLGAENTLAGIAESLLLPHISKRTLC